MLLDLGVSSHQLDAPARGFRFAEATAAETPLDMRMDRRSPVTAAEILRTRSAEELEAIFREGAELPGAARLARRLVEARQRAPLATTRDLLRVIEAARVGGGRRHHPATLVFQALRIAVNDELGALREGLDAADPGAAPGRPAGRDRLPLARGPLRQAPLPGGRARLHLPAAHPRLRLRTRAAACAC